MEAEAAESSARSAPRGDETRQRLIEGAMEVFADLGFNGASTRALAERAGANLAAISYHFGSKAGLYRAVARHIAEGMLAKLRPALEEVEAALAAGSLKRRELMRLLHLLVIETFAATVIGSEEAGKWSRFVVREQMRGGEAFEIIYGGAMVRLQKACGALVARLREVPEDDPRNIVRAVAIIGQILIFRIGRATMLKRMGWQDLTAEGLRLIQSVLREDLERIVSAPAKS
jgi:TetR/AcrR family transcriptional regulator, regulator of cefoperazone and chloramphenicol sensitivity